MSNKLTKIVATISDERCDKEFLQSLIEAGVNVVRLNTAHMTPEGMDRVVDNVRAVDPYVGILMDTKGPEIRTTKCDGAIAFKMGETVILKGAPEETTTHEQISLSYKEIMSVLRVGMRILIDDGDLELVVTEVHPTEAVCTVQNEAELKSRKSVNIPDVSIPLPSLTERDRTFIEYAIRKEIDFIAHSFVRTKEDVLDIQRILDAHNSPIEIIAKIENQEGVNNIDQILSVASGIMIARGDLGIEIPMEKIPGIQRHLIRKAIERKKPVIVATQMLHSMISSPRPTRAEVTDIANAIYYRTDAVMLSGETAYGKYPVEAVSTMSKIIYEAEQTRLEANDIRVPIEGDDLTTTAFLAKQAVKSVSKLNVKALLADSYTGRTARYLAAFRGKVPIYAVCYREPISRQLSISYGVKTRYVPLEKGKKQNLVEALEKLVSLGYLSMDDKVAHMSGNIGKKGSTNSLEIDTVHNLMGHK